MDQVYKSNQNKSIFEENNKKDQAELNAKSMQNQNIRDLQENISIGNLQDNPHQVGLQHQIGQANQQNQNIRENIRGNMPEDLALGEVHKEEYDSQDEQRKRTSYDTNYRDLSESTYSQTVVRIENGQRVERKEDNSLLMQEVKGKLAELNSLLQNQVALSDDTIEDITREFSMKYDEVIRITDEYIDRRFPFSSKGRDRMRFVKEINKSCKYERAQIRLAVRKANTEKKRRAAEHENLALTYGDILKYCRNVDITSAVKYVGGGVNSSVFKIKNDPQQRMFKKAERICKLEYKEVTDMMEEELLRNKKEKGNTDEIKVMTEFRDTLLKEMKDIIGNRQLTEDQLKKQARALIRLFAYDEYNNFDLWIEYNAANLLAVDKESEEGKAAINRLLGRMAPFYNAKLDCPDSTLTNNRKRVEAFANARIDNYFRNLKASNIALSNGIHEKADMTIRNVATNRMAAMLGFSNNIVIHCENATLKNKNTYMDGITMTRAEGISLWHLKGLLQMGDEWGNEVRHQDRHMTPEAAKQLMQLQLLDMICGQMDRHVNNIFVQYDEFLMRQGELMITGFTGIDNDMSFGDIGEKELKNGENRMAYLLTADGKPAIKHIDRETYNAIVNLQIEQVDLQLADMGLSAKERDALHTRIRILQQHLKEREKEKGFIINNYMELNKFGNRRLKESYAYDERNQDGSHKQSLVYYLADIHADKIQEE